MKARITDTLMCLAMGAWSVVTIVIGIVLLAGSFVCAWQRGVQGKDIFSEDEESE